MTDPIAESLSDLVATSQERIKELRRAGDPSALLAAANDAADQIEHRVGSEPRKVNSDAEHQALLAVKRFSYNAAADCWLGWSIPDNPPDTDNLRAAQKLAERSLGLVKQLGLGPLQEGTGIWLCGAFDLALGKLAEASDAFDAARQHYIAAKAPGLILLMEGYSTILRQIAGDQASAGGENLDEITARMAAGGFEDGAEWIEQLQTALNVFARSR
jgi:hypothetical protein